MRFHRLPKEVLKYVIALSFDSTRKEAAWAITNASSGGSADQIRYLVDQGCIPPLCDLLTVMDAKIVQVNIIQLGPSLGDIHVVGEGSWAEETK